MKYFKICVLIALCLLVLPGCNQSAGSGKNNDTKKVALVVDGYINDQGWCQLAYEALVKAESELGVEISYSERTQSTDYENVIGGYAAAGYDIVIAHGAEFYSTCLTLGPQYPETQFVVTSTDAGNKPNVNGVFVGVYETGFINGAAAALLSETGKIGVIGGMELSSIASWVQGAMDGAKYIDETVDVSVIYTGSFEDATKAREAAYALIEQGCDVITQNADASGEGAIIACDEKDVINIGAVGNQNSMGENVAFSVIQDTSIALFTMIQEGLRGELTGQGRSVGVADGCVYVTEYKAWVPEDVQERINTLVEDIGAGKLNNGSLYDWGITLDIKHVTPTGATIICTQSGGDVDGELNTGSWYTIERLDNGNWVSLEYVLDNVGWTMEGWIIPFGDRLKWEVDWEWLYGELPPGQYRFGKEISDFRGTGDYDQCVHYVNFVIE